MMGSELQTVALLAGEGNMPLKVLKGIHSSGYNVLLLGVHKVTDPRLKEMADFVEFIHVTQLGKAIQACLKRQVNQLVMAGRVHHRTLFMYSPWRLDWCCLKTWWKLKDKRADSILNGIVEVFANSGIVVMSSVAFLKDYLAKEGVLTKRQPSKEILQDAVFGVKIAKELGRLDIGQTVVVKKQSVVAIEAMEGTDLCIERAGEIAGRGCVVVKMPKPNQDMRFDVPVIGLNTIRKIAKAGASALIIEAERTVVIDEETITAADQLGIVLIALSREVTENMNS